MTELQKGATDAEVDAWIEEKRADHAAELEASRTPPTPLTAAELEALKDELDDDAKLDDWIARKKREELRANRRGL